MQAFRLYVSGVPYGIVWLTLDEVKSTLTHTNGKRYILNTNKNAVYQKETFV